MIGKLALLIDQAEKIYFEAWSKQPAEFFSEPLWYTWTFSHLREYKSDVINSSGRRAARYWLITEQSTRFRLYSTITSITCLC